MITWNSFNDRRTKNARKNYIENMKNKNKKCMNVHRFSHTRYFIIYRHSLPVTASIFICAPVDRI